MCDGGKSSSSSSAHVEFSQLLFFSSRKMFAQSFEKQVDNVHSPRQFPDTYGKYFLLFLRLTTIFAKIKARLLAVGEHVAIVGEILVRFIFERSSRRPDWLWFCQIQYLSIDRGCCSSSRAVLLRFHEKIVQWFFLIVDRDCAGWVSCTRICIHCWLSTKQSWQRQQELCPSGLKNFHIRQGFCGFYIVSVSIKSDLDLLSKTFVLRKWMPPTKPIFNLRQQCLVWLSHRLKCRILFDNLDVTVAHLLIEFKTLLYPNPLKAFSHFPQLHSTATKTELIKKYDFWKIEFEW